MTWLRHLGGALGGVAIAALALMLWVRFVHDPSVRAQEHQLAHLDSTAAQARTDSAIAAARDSTARADSATHAKALAAAHQVTVAIAQVANALAPRVRASVADLARTAFDSLMRAKDSTVASAEHERDLEHQDKLAALARVTFYRDTVAVDLRKQLADALGQAKTALARTGRHWHVGLAGGYGATAHGGIVYAGPTLNAGVTYTP